MIVEWINLTDGRKKIISIQYKCVVNNLNSTKSQAHITTVVSLYRQTSEGFVTALVVDISIVHSYIS